MVELLKTSDTSTERDQEVAEALSALLNGNGNKKRVSVRLGWMLLPALLTAPDLHTKRVADSFKCERCL
jgi:hypothetical protein